MCRVLSSQDKVPYYVSERLTRKLKLFSFFFRLAHHEYTCNDDKHIYKQHILHLSDRIKECGRKDIII